MVPGGICQILSMVIFNRGRKGTPMADRAKSMMVLISIDGLVWEKVYSGGEAFGGVLDNAPLSINSQDGVLARYVTLQLAEANYFHLDEVEIFGTCRA